MDFCLRLESEPQSGGHKTKNVIRITGHGKVIQDNCGTAVHGKSILRVEVNGKGQIEYRHNDALLHTSSQAPAFPLFLKIFAFSNGPIIQRLTWQPPRSLEK